jgi:hypothetical protein
VATAVVAAATGLAACPVRAATGLECPACGITRGTLALLRFEPIEALRYNAVFPLLWAVIAVALMPNASRRLWPDGPSPALVRAVIAVCVLFTVARNVTY